MFDECFDCGIFEVVVADFFDGAEFDVSGDFEDFPNEFGAIECLIGPLKASVVVFPDLCFCPFVSFVE